MQQLCISTKPSGKVRSCLDPVRLNKALIRLVHRGPTVNDIFPKLKNAKYLSLADAHSGYHNLKFDDRLSYHKHRMTDPVEDILKQFKNKTQQKIHPQ